MTAAEYRTDLWSDRQVIVAKNRSNRPQALSAQAIQAEEVAEGNELQDPFLEGREQNTPQESVALRRIGTEPNQPGWLLRIVANRYPAVSALSLDSAEVATGIHDVVIECPDFRQSWLQFSIFEIVRVLFAWQLRLRILSCTEGIEFIQVFRNQGAAAGASLGHSHSQILALSRIPGLAARRLRNADAFQQWRDSETLHGKRVVSDNGLLVVCPESSWVAGQVRLCSSSGSSANAVPFHQLSFEALRGVAIHLQRSLLVVQSSFPGVSFNLILNQPPVRHIDAFPWSIDIMPRTASFAGFELGCDIPIVTSEPEECAVAYRATWRELGQELAIPHESQLSPHGYSWMPSESVT